MTSISIIRTRYRDIILLTNEHVLKPTIAAGLFVFLNKPVYVDHVLHYRPNSSNILHTGKLHLGEALKFIHDRWHAFQALRNNRIILRRNLLDFVSEGFLKCINRVSVTSTPLLSQIQSQSPIVRTRIKITQNIACSVYLTPGYIWRFRESHVC